MSWILQSFFHSKRQNCDTEKLGNLSKVTQLPNYGARIQIQEMRSKVYAITNCCTILPSATYLSIYHLVTYLSIPKQNILLLQQHHDVIIMQYVFF